MALPKIGDGEQVGDGNVGETLVVGASGQPVTVGTANTMTVGSGLSTVNIGSAVTSKVGFYGTTPIVQRAAAVQAASVVSAASYISVSTNLSVFAAEVAATLTALGLWKGAA